MSFKKFQILLAFLLFTIASFYGGYYFGKRGFVFHLRQNPPSIVIENKYPQNREIDFALFWEVWDMVSETYLERPVDAKSMMYGAIEGMVDSLGDPYTVFLPPELNENFNNTLNGQYQGIGAELAIRDERLIIVSPLDGSPALDAGVQAGDVILEVDGKSTVGMSVTEAVFNIRGDAGTIVKLTLQRNNATPFEVSITRGVISIDSVTWEDKGEGTAYIRVSRFGSETTRDWSKVVAEVNTNMSTLDAVILDVRGNPGGYLQAAVYIADEFMQGVPAMHIEDAVGNIDTLDTDRLGAFENIPDVIVLIDGGSASASEILAAALKENIDATLVGTQSFGKGTIQDAKEFRDDSGVHITIAKWLTPEKNWVHNVGLEPDVVVERTAEDINAGIDVQLDTALELANEI